MSIYAAFSDGSMQLTPYKVGSLDENRFFAVMLIERPQEKTFFVSKSAYEAWRWNEPPDSLRIVPGTYTVAKE